MPYTIRPAQKIVQSGGIHMPTEPTSWWLHKPITCNSCKCIYAYDVGDIVPSVDNHSIWTRCPECRDTRFVFDSLLNSILQRW